MRGSVGFWACDPSRSNLHIPLLYSDRPHSLIVDLYILTSHPKRDDSLVLYVYIKMLMRTAFGSRPQEGLGSEKWDWEKKWRALQIVKAPSQAAGAGGSHPLYLLAYLYPLLLTILVLCDHLGIES